MKFAGNVFWQLDPLVQYTVASLSAFDINSPSFAGSKSAKSVTLVICTVVETDEGPVGWGVGAAFTRESRAGVLDLDVKRDRFRRRASCFAPVLRER